MTHPLSRPLHRSPVLWLLTAALTACGGGTTPAAGGTNKLPEVTVRGPDGKVLTADTYLASGGDLTLNVSDLDGSVRKVTYIIDKGQAAERGGELTPAASMKLAIPALAGGSHTLTVTATDNVGGETTATATFRVDAAAPEVQYLALNGAALLPGETVNLTLGDAALLEMDATDTRGDGAGTAGPVTVRVLEGSALRASSASGTLSADLGKKADGSARTAGPVTFTAEAVDSVGYSVRGTFTVNFAAAGEVDTSKPTFTWLTPAGAFVRGGSAVTLRATASRNDTDLGGVTYSATCGTVTAGVWTLDAGCADGSKQTVTATVSAGGKTYSDSRTVTVDASNPTIQITSPGTGTTVTANPVKVSVAATDAVSGVASVLVEASRDGGAYEQVGVIGAASGDVTWAPSNGTYTLRATATDNTGRTNTTSIGNVRVQLTSSDSAAPRVTALNLPGGTQRGTVTVTATVTDDAPSSGVAKVELFEGGTSLGVQTAGVGGTYTFSVDTAKLTDGPHTLRAVATDNVGLSGQLTGALTTDNTAPAVSWIAPADGGVTGGTVTLNATSNEGRVTYAVDGAAVTDDADPTRAGFQVKLPDGTHKLTATATDDARNTTSSTITVTADGTAPTAQITGPSSGAVITSNPVTVNVAGSDNLSGVTSLEVFANGTSIGTVAGAQGSVTWAPTTGEYALTVIATDRAGNRSAAGTPVNVSVRLATADTSAPVFGAVPTLQPAPRNTLSRGSVTLDGTVRDDESGVAQVTLFDGGTRLDVAASLSRQPDGSTRYAFTLDTTALLDGTHTLTVQATNGVGLVANQTVRLDVDNTAPGLTWNAPSAVGIGGVLALNATSESGATVVYTASCGVISGASWNYSACTDGTTATLTATATDPAGNVTRQTRTLLVDRTAPTVQITGPQAGQKFTQNPVTVTVSGTDNLGIDHIDVFSGTTKIGTVSGAQGSVTWAPASGTYTLTAVATDRAGNTASTEVGNVQVALTTTSAITPNAPTVSGTTSGSGPVYIRGLGRVEGSASSTGTITSGQLLIDGQPAGTGTGASNGTPVSFSLDFNTLNEGLHDLAIRWTDNAGVLADSPKVGVYVDKTAPTLTWNTPKPGTVTRVAPIVLSATTADAGAGARNEDVTYSVDGQTVGSTWTPGAEGTYTVTASSADLVGNRASQNTTVTYDVTGPEITPLSPASGQEFNGTPITISASAADKLTGVVSMAAIITGPDGTTTPMEPQQGSRYSASFTPTRPGAYEVRFTATDGAQNVSTSAAQRFSYTVTTAPTEKAPAPILSVVGAGPYTGNMSVNVSGTFDTMSQVDRVILQITDSKGFVDNTSYVTGQNQASFSIDTTKFANGDLKLQVIAYTKTGLRGVSEVTTVQVRNVINPMIAVAAPSNGATVSTPTVPVRVTITKSGDTSYTFNPATASLDLMDYRGQLIQQKKAACAPSADAATYTCDTSFDIAGLPADTYTLRATAQVVVDGAGSNPQTLTTESRFTSNTVSVNPPAATISFPTAVTLTGGTRIPARIDSGSGFFATVGDDKGIQYVEARLVGPYAEGNIETDGTRQCQASGSILPGESEINVLVLNVPGAANLPYTPQDIFIPKLDVDGSTYVPDSKPGQRYDMRVTTADSEGNRNIQCVPVRVERNLVRPNYTVSNVTTPGAPSTTPGELTYTSGTWYLDNVPANSRVAAVFYANGKQVGTNFFAKTTGGRLVVSQTFADVGTYEVKWLIEDMSPTLTASTGVVTTQDGGFINVARNPK